MNLKNYIHRFIPIAKKNFERLEALAVVAVNTTFIAVLIACLSAYIAYTNSIIQQAEIKAIEEAEKINDIVFLVRHCPFRALDSSEVFDKDQLIAMMQDLMIGRDGVKIPKDLDERAEKAFGIMSALVNQYPFPEIIFKTDDGSLAVRSDAESLTFANLHEVRLWIDYIQKTINIFALELTGVHGNLLALFKQFANGEYVAQIKRIVNESPILRPLVQSDIVTGLGTHITSEGLDPVLVYQDFLSGIAETARIMKSTSNYVKRADVFRNGYASKSLQVLVLLLTLIAFFSGVIYPLTAKTVKQIIALWLPVTAYLTIGILVSIKIL